MLKLKCWSIKIYNISQARLDRDDEKSKYFFLNVAEYSKTTTGKKYLMKATSSGYWPAEPQPGFRCR